MRDTGSVLSGMNLETTKKLRMMFHKKLHELFDVLLQTTKTQNDVAEKHLHDETGKSGQNSDKSSEYKPWFSNAWPSGVHYSQLQNRRFICVTHLPVSWIRLHLSHCAEFSHIQTLLVLTE